MRLTYYLILDKRCNMSCIYCFQGQNHHSYKQFEYVDPKKVASYFPVQDDTIQIVFFGGEPFLRFDYMIEIAKEIRMTNPSPNMELNVTTNGLLLTKERAKTLNDLEIAVSLSHDGPCYEITRRSKDFLFKDPEPFIMINDKKIVCTVSKYNWNYYDIWNYFEEFRSRNGLKDKLSVHLNHLKCKGDNVDTSMMIYQYKPWEDMLDGVFNTLYETIIQDNYDTYEYLTYQILFGKFLRQLQSPKITAYCQNEDVNTNLDILGNIYDCNGELEPVGHISTGAVKLFNHNIFTQRCQNCEILRYCGGGCNKISSDRLKYFCYTQRNEYSRMINLLTKLLDHKNNKGDKNAQSHNFQSQISI